MRRHFRRKLASTAPTNMSPQPPHLPTPPANVRVDNAEAGISAVAADIAGARGDSGGLLEDETSMEGLSPVSDSSPPVAREIDANSSPRSSPLGISSPEAGDNVTPQQNNAITTTAELETGASAAEGSSPAARTAADVDYNSTEDAIEFSRLNPIAPIFTSNPNASVFDDCNDGSPSPSSLAFTGPFTAIAQDMAQQEAMDFPRFASQTPKLECIAEEGESINSSLASTPPITPTNVRPAAVTSTPTADLPTPTPSSSTLSPTLMRETPTSETPVPPNEAIGDAVDDHSTMTMPMVKVSCESASAKPASTAPAFVAPGNDASDPAVEAESTRAATERTSTPAGRETTMPLAPIADEIKVAAALEAERSRGVEREYEDTNQTEDNSSMKEEWRSDREPETANRGYVSGGEEREEEEKEEEVEGKRKDRTEKDKQAGGEGIEREEANRRNANDDDDEANQTSAEEEEEEEEDEEEEAVGARGVAVRVTEEGAEEAPEGGDEGEVPEGDRVVLAEVVRAEVQGDGNSEEIPEDGGVGEEVAQGDVEGEEMPEGEVEGDEVPEGDGVSEEAMIADTEEEEMDVRDKERKTKDTAQGEEEREIEIRNEEEREREAEAQTGGEERTEIDLEKEAETGDTENETKMISEEKLPEDHGDGTKKLGIEEWGRREEEMSQGGASAERTEEGAAEERTEERTEEGRKYLRFPSALGTGKDKVKKKEEKKRNMEEEEEEEAREICDERQAMGAKEVEDWETKAGEEASTEARLILSPWVHEGEIDDVGDQGKLPTAPPPLPTASTLPRTRGNVDRPAAPGIFAAADAASRHESASEKAVAVLSVDDAGIEDAGSVVNHRAGEEDAALSDVAAAVIVDERERRSPEVGGAANGMSEVTEKKAELVERVKGEENRMEEKLEKEEEKEGKKMNLEKGDEEGGVKKPETTKATREISDETSTPLLIDDLLKDEGEEKDMKSKRQGGGGGGGGEEKPTTGEIKMACDDGVDGFDVSGDGWEVFGDGAEVSCHGKEEKTKSNGEKFSSSAKTGEERGTSEWIPGRKTGEIRDVNLPERVHLHQFVHREVDSLGALTKIEEKRGDREEEIKGGRRSGDEIEVEAKEGKEEEGTRFRASSFDDEMKLENSCSNSFSEGFELESAVSADSLVNDFGVLEEFKREKMEKRRALGFGDCCPEVTPSILGFRSEDGLLASSLHTLVPMEAKSDMTRAKPEKTRAKSEMTETEPEMALDVACKEVDDNTEAADDPHENATVKDTTLLDNVEAAEGAGDAAMMMQMTPSTTASASMKTSEEEEAETSKRKVESKASALLFEGEVVDGDGDEDDDDDDGENDEREEGRRGKETSYGYDGDGGDAKATSTEAESAKPPDAKRPKATDAAAAECCVKANNSVCGATDGINLFKGSSDNAVLCEAGTDVEVKTNAENRLYEHNASTSSLLSRSSPNSSVADEISLHLADSTYQVACINREEEEEEEEKSRRQMLKSEAMRGRGSEEQASPNSAADEISVHLADANDQVAPSNEDGEEEEEESGRQTLKLEIWERHSSGEFVSPNSTADEISLHLADSTYQVTGITEEGVEKEESRRQMLKSDILRRHSSGELASTGSSNSDPSSPLRLPSFDEERNSPEDVAARPQACLDDISTIIDSATNKEEEVAAHPQARLDNVSTTIGWATKEEGKEEKDVTHRQALYDDILTTVDSAMNEEEETVARPQAQFDNVLTTIDLATKEEGKEEKDVATCHQARFDDVSTTIDSIMKVEGEEEEEKEKRQTLKRANEGVMEDEDDLHEAAKEYDESSSSSKEAEFPKEGRAFDKMEEAEEECCDVLKGVEVEGVVEAAVEEVVAIEKPDHISQEQSENSDEETNKEVKDEKPHGEIGEEQEEDEDLYRSLAAKLIASHRLFFYEGDENPLKASMEQFHLPIITEEGEEEEEGEETKVERQERVAPPWDNKDEVGVGNFRGAETVSTRHGVSLLETSESGAQNQVTAFSEATADGSSDSNSADDADAEPLKDSTAGSSEQPRLISPSSTEHSLLLFVTEAFIQEPSVKEAEEEEGKPTKERGKREAKEEKTPTDTAVKPVATTIPKVPVTKRVTFGNVIGAKSDAIVEKKMPTTDSRKNASASSSSLSTASSTFRRRRLAPAKSEPLNTPFKTPQKPTLAKPLQRQQQESSISSPRTPATSSQQQQRHRQQPRQKSSRPKKEPTGESEGEVEETKVGDSAEKKMEKQTRAAPAPIDGEAGDPAAIDENVASNASSARVGTVFKEALKGAEEKELVGETKRTQAEENKGFGGERREKQTEEKTKGDQDLLSCEDRNELKEEESVLELLDKESKKTELSPRGSELWTSSSSKRSGEGVEAEDWLMPRLPALYYEPKDMTKLTRDQIRRERILRRHLKEKFFPSPPPHLLEKKLQMQQQRHEDGSGNIRTKRKPTTKRERPWATSSFGSYEDSSEARKLRNTFFHNSTKCALHKSPYLQPQAHFHTRDPGNRPGVTEGTWMVARPQPDGTIAMETRNVGQPVIQGTVTYRFSEQLLKARKGVSKAWSGPTAHDLRPPSLALDLEPFEGFPKSKLNYAHLPQIRERAAMVKRRYLNKVNDDRSGSIADFRHQFHEQLRIGAAPPKTQQRLGEMLDRYVPLPKQPPPLVRRSTSLPPIRRPSSTSVGSEGKRRL